MKRFWDKVEKTDGCWNWKAGNRGNGYGCFKYEGRVWDSHRFAWYLTYGNIPKGLLICHHCDNKLCVNPKHLFLGSYRDNILDSFSKGRINYRKGKIFTNHGTITMYMAHKCRCELCKKAKSIALKRQRASISL